MQYSKYYAYVNLKTFHSVFLFVPGRFQPFQKWSLGMPFNAYFVLSILFSLLHIVWHEKRWNHWIYFRAKRHAEIECPCWYSNGLQSTGLKTVLESLRSYFSGPEFPEGERQWAMFQLHFYTCLKNLSSAACLASRLPRRPLSGLCWEAQNQLLKLLFSSTFYKILPHSDFMLLSARCVFYPAKFCIVPVSGWISRDFSSE